MNRSPPRNSISTRRVETDFVFFFEKWPTVFVWTGMWTRCALHPSPFVSCLCIMSGAQLNCVALCVSSCRLTNRTRPSRCENDSRDRFSADGNAGNHFDESSPEVGRSGRKLFFLFIVRHNSPFSPASLPRWGGCASFFG